MKAGANKHQVIENCQIGKNTIIWNFVNLFGCKIGNDCMIGSFVEIQKGVEIGDKSRIQSHSFICEGVKIEAEVFVGHHVVFINDNYPKITNPDGSLRKYGQWPLLPVLVKRGASIGSNATILGGVTIGKDAIVGAGAVITKDVPDKTIVISPKIRLKRNLPPFLTLKKK